MKTNPPIDLPSAKIRQRRRIAPVWIIPLLAAAASGWLIYSSLRESGPLITIIFGDGDGVQANQTILKYHGVRVGEVHSVRLMEDLQHVEVQARLLRSAAGLACDGSQFWVVRPEVSSAGLHGLETIVSGPYIQVQPGQGRRQNQFAGLDKPPVTSDFTGKFEVVVTTPQITTLSSSSPVYYRGIEVGSVAYFSLSDDARFINIHLLIATNYAPLVRADTKFWNAGGISFRLKLLGINVSAENFKSLMIGGIAFATPASTNPPARSGTVFPLYDKPDNDWLKWSPPIAISTPQTGPTGNLNSPSTMLLNDVDSSGK